MYVTFQKVPCFFLRKDSSKASKSIHYVCENTISLKPYMYLLKSVCPTNLEFHKLQSILQNVVRDYRLFKKNSCFVFMIEDLSGAKEIFSCCKETPTEPF